MSSLAEAWAARLEGDSGIELDQGALGRFPELSEAAVPVGFEIVPDQDETSYLTVDADANVQMRLIGSLIPPGETTNSDPDRLGALEVEIDSAERQLLLGTLDLPGHVRQAGLGRIIIGQLAILGDRLDLETIETQAGKIGRWAWLRCGFDFADNGARAIVVSVAADFAARLGVEVDLSSIEHSWDFIDLPGTVTAAQIAAAGGAQDITPADEPIQLGKALILGPPPRNLWFGRLELDRRSAGRVRLDSYVLGDGISATLSTES